MTDPTVPPVEVRVAQRALEVAGAAAVLVGVLAIAFGSVWASEALGLSPDNTIGSLLDLIVPFLPILLIMFGAFLLAKSRG